MSQEWYIHRQGVTDGPVSGQRLRELSAQGQLNADDLVWRAGMDQWLPARSLGLFGSSASIPPPVPTAPPTPPVPKPVARTKTAARRATVPWPVWIALTLALGVVAGWLTRSAAWSDARDARATASSKSATASRSFNQPQEARSAQAVLNGSDRREQPTTSEASAADDSPSLFPDRNTTPESIPPDDAPVRSPERSSEPTVQPRAPLPSSQQPTVLFQEIHVHRTPVMTIQGVPLNQEVRYRVVSQLTLQSQDDDNSLHVQQQVIDATLEHADEMSHGEYEKSINKLTGQSFTYRVLENGRVTDFKGHRESRAALSVDSTKERGFMIVSLIDEDGWKELTQLTFFRPPAQVATNESWQDQMTHDWGPLGSWSGITTFTPQTPATDAVRQYSYVHDMSYKPPATATSALPFGLTDVEFEPVEAGGVIRFDPRVARVIDAQERFHVRGVIKTQLFGEDSALHLEEQQVLTLRLSDQRPQ